DVAVGRACVSALVAGGGSPATPLHFCTSGGERSLARRPLAAAGQQLCFFGSVSQCPESGPVLRAGADAGGVTGRPDGTVGATLPGRTGVTLGGVSGTGLRPPAAASISPDVSPLAGSLPFLRGSSRTGGRAFAGVARTSDWSSMVMLIVLVCTPICIPVRMRGATRSNQPGLLLPNRSENRTTSAAGRRAVVFALGIPVRVLAVVLVDVEAPTVVRHVGPRLLVETRRRLELVLRDVEDELVVGLRRLPQRMPRDREQLVAHPEEAAEREHAVHHAAGRVVDHQVVDVTEVLPGGVLDLHADRLGRTAAAVRAEVILVERILREARRILRRVGADLPVGGRLVELGQGRAVRAVELRPRVLGEARRTLELLLRHVHHDDALVLRPRE